MVRSKALSTPVFINRTGYMLLLVAAGATVLFAQGRGAPTAQQRSIVYQEWTYNNSNCEGRPSSKMYTLDLATPGRRGSCNPMIVEAADAVGVCDTWTEGLSYNGTCREVIKDDWEVPPPGYLCEIKYSSRGCGETFQSIDQVSCYTTERLGSTWNIMSGPPGSLWSLTPVPASAGTSADTMIFTWPKETDKGWMDPQPGPPIKNGRCTNGSKYVLGF